MSKSNRNDPQRAQSSESRFSRFEFERMFPDDAACLDWLYAHRYPDGAYCPTCKKVTKRYRETGRPSYSCHCGHHVHPMKGTIFQSSATSLRLWFLAIYLMASTRCGISAKQLEREIGVTYKCAWRMFKQIRSMLNEDVLNLLGEVEVDESFFGGKSANKHLGKRKGHAGKFEDKAAVFGMLERGGRVVVQVVPMPPKSRDLLPHIKAKIMPRSTIFSDEAAYYDPLTNMGYGHKRVHHAEQVYVSGDAHTNTIEGFWSLCKRGISGVHHVVGRKYLQDYLNSYSFRWNHRNGADPMFFEMVKQIPIAPAPKQGE